jgi:hypothetical protein
MLLQILRFHVRLKCARLKCALVLRKLKRLCSTRAKPLVFSAGVFIKRTPALLRRAFRGFFRLENLRFYI